MTKWQSEEEARMQIKNLVAEYYIEFKKTEQKKTFAPSFFLIHIFSILTKSVTKIHFSQTYRHYNRCHSHGATHASSIPSCFHWFCSSEYPFTSKY